MKKIVSYSLFFVFLLLSAACSNDEETFPSVKLEFLTVYSGPDGQFLDVVTDKGEKYQVGEDRTKSKIKPDSYMRIISNYELYSESSSQIKARIYNIGAPVSVVPVTAKDFNNPIKTDPADVLSIWMGWDYMNIILALQAKDKKHLFHFIQESVEVTATTKTVNLLLYHDAGGDMEAYTKRAYLSVPLSQYAKDKDSQGKKIIVRFKYYRRDKDGQVVAETKYCEPGFEYVPSNMK